MSRYNDYLVFRCNHTLIQELERVSDAMNMSKSNAMRVALQSFITKNMTKVHAAQIESQISW